MIDASALLAVVDEALLMGANQRRAELVAAASVIGYEPASRVLEIGQAFGGTLYLWGQLATDDAQICGIDIDHSQLSERFRTNPAQRLLLCEGDSRDGRIFGSVADFLDGDLDFLFLDGAHDEETVRSDFETYGPLVREGGWVGFHDIASTDGVRAVWDEVCQAHPERVEIIIEPLHRMGIGLLKV